MSITTSAIVFSNLKYGDTSLIVRCYTQTDGLKSYLLKGIRSGKSKSLTMGMFQPLNILELTENRNTKSGLGIIRSAKIKTPYQSIYTDITKTTIALFISEILTHVIREEEPNNHLFSFIEHSLLWFDMHQKVVNFHLLFLLSITRHLGFYPDQNNMEFAYFDLKNGIFVNEYLHLHCIGGEKIILFKRLLGTTFDNVCALSLSSDQRKSMLELILLYFSFHLHGFRKPKSLSILYEVFRP